MNAHITMKNIITKEKSLQIIKETVDEYLDINFNQLKNNQHNLPIVYQLAFSDRLPSIFRNGFSREYAATARR